MRCEAKAFACTSVALCGGEHRSRFHGFRALAESVGLEIRSGGAPSLAHSSRVFERRTGFCEERRAFVSKLRVGIAGVTKWLEGVKSLLAKSP